jgi:PKD repeat protein
MRPKLEITYLDCTPPTVGFEYTTTGLSASFTGTSPSATSWYWDFGDGDTSNVQNPEHTFAHQGIYEVCLRVEDTCYFAETCQVIEVCTGPPVPAFSYTVQGMTALFQNLTPDAQNFHWEFGDGDTSNLANPSHTYTDVGVYQVSLTAWNSCGSDMFWDFIDVCILPENGFYYYADGTNVQFWEYALMAERFWWDFGDGSFSEFSNPSHEYSQPGEYYVCLEAINDCGSDVICDWVYVDYVRIPEIPDPKAHQFKIYPNPSNGMVNITSDFQGRINLTLINLQGKVLMNQDLILDGRDQSLNLSGFQPGIYLLRINDGTMISVGKIVLI